MPLLLVLVLLCLLVPGYAQTPFGVPAENTPAPTPQIESLIALARATVKTVVTGAPQPPAGSENGQTPAQGVFVTIERRGVVIGCRGTLHPRTRSLGDEVIAAARSAAAFDPRYRPLTPADLKDFLVTVTLVERLEPIEREALASLSPVEGLVLRAGDRTGVVLPYEGKAPALRLKWAYKKAGVPEGASCTLWRMVAPRYRG